MRNFTRMYVEHYLNQNERFVLSKNKSLSNPHEAYSHLLSTVITTIKDNVAFVSDAEPKCENYTTYLTFISQMKQNMINSIVNHNKFNRTITAPKFSEYDKSSTETKYYQFAKATYAKVQEEKVAITKLNDDALLAYNLFHIVSHVTKAAFTWDEESQLVGLNSNSKFVADYYDLLEDIKSTPESE